MAEIYYLDFCKKYHFGHSRPESLPQFLEKLREKKQTTQQRKQATQAINVYYEFIRDDDKNRSSSPNSNLSSRQGRASISQAQSAGNKGKERGKVITPASYGKKRYSVESKAGHNNWGGSIDSGAASKTKGDR